MITFKMLSIIYQKRWNPISFKLGSKTKILAGKRVQVPPAPQFTSFEGMRGMY